MDSNLGYFEVKGVLEVLGLSDDHQIKAPAATEVGDDDRIDRHRSQKRLPRRLEELSIITKVFFFNSEFKGQLKPQFLFIPIAFYAASIHYAHVPISMITDKIMIT